MRVLGYARVSTNEQAVHGCSVIVQEERIRAYCQLYGLELVEVIQDAGQSAKNLNRPGLQRALTMLDNNQAQGICVSKLDRLTRSLGDWQHLIKRYFGGGQATLLSVADQIDTRTASGACVLNILISISEWERRAIGERTSIALQHKRKQGIHIGRAPYGCKMVNGRLVDDTHEKNIIALALSLRASGKTMAQIANDFTAKGIQSKRGGQWHPSTIRNLLQRHLAKEGNSA